MKKMEFHLPFDQKSFTLYGSESDQSVLYYMELENGYYEAYVMNLLRRVVAPDAVCLDIGANLGTISLAFSHLAKKGKVYAFEPSNVNYGYLVQTIADNSIRNIEPLKLGVFDRNGTISFREVAHGGGWSFIDTKQTDSTDSSSQITCVRLDDWVITSALERIDIIKVDVEGSEMEVLQGGAETFRRFDPDLVIEFNLDSMVNNFGKNPLDLFTLLQSMYANMYLIRRDDQVVKVTDYDSLLEMIKPFHGDLYCTNKKAWG
ncbi:FkbM family methyltransferase [Brevibacillus invocatus]